MNRTLQTLQNQWERNKPEVLFYGVTLLGAAYVVRSMANSDMSWEIFYKWVFLVVTTIVVLGIYFTKLKMLWRYKSYWGYLVGGLAVHCALGLALQRYVPYWWAIWIVLIFAELGAFVPLRDRAVIYHFDHAPRRRSTSRSAQSRRGD